MRLSIWITLGCLSTGLAGCYLEYEEHYYDPPPHHDPPLSQFYEPCAHDLDCVGGTFCESLDTPLPEGHFYGAICTFSCDFLGPDSIDCPRGITGEYGSCYPSYTIGGIDSLPVCFERCLRDGDCFHGFVCADHADLPGIARGDKICVPGP